MILTRKVSISVRMDGQCSYRILKTKVFGAGACLCCRNSENQLIAIHFIKEIGQKGIQSIPLKKRVAVATKLFLLMLNIL